MEDIEVDVFGVLPCWEETVSGVLVELIGRESSADTSGVESDAVAGCDAANAAPRRGFIELPEA